MQTINISLTPPLIEQINYQVKAGNYASVSEFIREAIRKFLGIAPTAFSPKAEEEILRISQKSPKDDFVFDSSKTSVKKMFAQLKKAKI